jgi:hypothetical protein
MPDIKKPLKHLVRTPDNHGQAHIRIGRELLHGLANLPLTSSTPNHPKNIPQHDVMVIDDIHSMI